MVSINNIDRGLFLPTTYEFDVSQLSDMKVDSDDFKELIVRLYQNINNMILAINLKETGYYVLTPFVTGQLWYPDPTISNNQNYRPIHRKVVPFGPIGSGANTPVAHGIPFTNKWAVVNIDAVAVNNTGTFLYYPLPWASASGSANIQLYLDKTNIYINNQSGQTFNLCDVVIEYRTF